MNDNYRRSRPLPATLMRAAIIALIAGLAPLAWSFDSGSDGSHGAFAPMADIALVLPPDGVLHFTTITIPDGVTVMFKKNAANTPVTLLASGDVTINGVIDISGFDSTAVGVADGSDPGDTVDDGLYGVGGPGGFNGGRGGVPGNIVGAAGLGPGAGNQAPRRADTTGNKVGTGCGGGGAGYLNAGEAYSSGDGNRLCGGDNDRAPGGKTYGIETLLPLIGGSGGGGGSAGNTFAGSGGGGGGGAILIASSGAVTVSGAINANGGSSGSAAGNFAGGTGGGGSGGAIRIIAKTIDGNGAITALGGIAGAHMSNDSGSQGGSGSDGRIRLEADTYKRTAPTSPDFSFAAPQEVFVPGLPSLRISSVADVTAPLFPTGDADIILPQSTANPVAVTFETKEVPPGSTVELTVTPGVSGSRVSVVSAAITGSQSAGVANVSVDLPDGPSVLSAAVSFTVPIAMEKQTDLSRFTQGEPVRHIRLKANPSTGSSTTLVTSTGKEYTWSANAVVN